MVFGSTFAVTVNVVEFSPAVKFSLAADVILTVFKPTVKLPAPIVKVALPSLTFTTPTSLSPTKTLTAPVKLPRAEIVITTSLPSSISLTGAIANSGLTGTILAVTVNEAVFSQALKYLSPSNTTVTLCTPASKAERLYEPLPLIIATSLPLI